MQTLTVELHTPKSLPNLSFRQVGQDLVRSFLYCHVQEEVKRESAFREE